MTSDDAVPRTQPRHDRRGRAGGRSRCSCWRAFRAEDLPLIGGGDVYYAEFSEAGGLKINDEVRVAGVRVGQVEDITLDEGHVLVEFRIDRDTELGDDTGASIRVKTLLGAMYLALEPAGAGELEPDDDRSRSPGPRRRTTSWRRSAAWPRPSSGSTPTSSPTSLEHPRRPVPRHPRRGAGVADRAVAAEPQPRRPRRAAQDPADQRRQAVSKVLADRNDEPRDAVRGRRRAAAGAVRPPRRGPRPARRDGQRSRRQLTGLVEDTRADLQAGARPPRQRGRPAQRGARTSSTTACG